MNTIDINPFTLNGIEVTTYTVRPPIGSGAEGVAKLLAGGETIWSAIVTCASSDRTTITVDDASLPGKNSAERYRTRLETALSIARMAGMNEVKIDRVQSNITE